MTSNGGSKLDCIGRSRAKWVVSVYSAELVTKQAAKNQTFPAGQAGDAMATYAHLQFLPLLMNNIPTFMVLKCIRPYYFTKYILYFQL
jgi:hypothetical protein